ncbi:MAG: enolase C-terminal domain-like protein, partial [Pseudomonadota bacterium]|nr:enolase C-terminal domain-like protein [Pseudomonadota bacterium]
TDAPRQRLPVYLSGLRQATRKDRVETLKKWLDSGLTGVKIFLNGDVDEGCEELAALQSAAPETEQWMADTLWMCDPDGARRAKTQLADQGVRFLECPLQPEDLRGHRELVAAPGVAIALGEHFRTHYQTEVWFESPRGLDIFQLDVGRTGLSDGLRQIEQATSAGVASTPHMGNGLAVFQAATLHFAAACDGQYLQEYQAGLAERGASIGSTDWQYDEGAFVVPDTPGLGIQIDEEAVSRYSSR